MALSDTLSSQIATAMKARDANRLTALRMLKTALTNKSVEKGRALDDAEELQVVGALVKQRRDSIEQFEKAARMDLAAKEAAEITVLETFLPAAASDEEVRAAVDAAVTATGASGPKDMGKVMGVLKAKYAGKMDFQKASAAVKAALG